MKKITNIEWFKICLTHKVNEYGHNDIVLPNVKLW